MPRFSSPSRDPGPNRPELERELTDLEAKVRALEAQIKNLPLSARANTEAEISRLKSKISDICRTLGR